MVNRWGNNGNSDRLFLGGSKTIADGDCSHEIKRHFLLGRKAMTNLGSILKSREVTLLTKVHLVKAMVFPVVMHGCASWTINKAEGRRIDAFELWCWRRFLRFPNPGIEPRSPALQADSLLSESPGKPKAQWGVGLNCCCYFLSQIQTRRLPTAFQSITITNMTTRKIPVCPCRARSSDLVNRSRADEEGLRTGRSPKANLKSECPVTPRIS